MVQGALRKDATILGFGEKADAYRLIALKSYKDVTVIQAQLRGAPAVLKINAVGHHFAMNALGVLAAVEALAGDPGRAAVDLFRWKPSAGRGRRELISLDPDKSFQEFELIDDAYNANPASMVAAFESLASMQPAVVGTAGRKSRKIAILGDMLELGVNELTYHSSLAKNLHLCSLDVVHCVGTRMRSCYDGLPVEIPEGLGETAMNLKPNYNYDLRRYSFG